jgi:hypothetical protein
LNRAGLRPRRAPARARRHPTSGVAHAAQLAAVLALLGAWPAAPARAQSAHTGAPGAGTEASAPVERTAATHPMRYWVSRPQGWSARRRWPVVLVIPGAEREFLAETRAFAAARGTRPLLVVTPLVLSAGGTAQDHRPEFDYPEAAWARAARDGNCTFDRDGLDAVLADIQRLDAADSVVMLAAFEAGGHVAWAQLFSRPQRIATAALVTPNYIGRCVDEAGIPRFEEHRVPPVRAFAGGRDSLWTANSPIRGQWLRARAIALAHGFQSLTEIVVPDKGHEFMADTLLQFLDSASRR